MHTVYPVVRVRPGLGLGSDSGLLKTIAGDALYAELMPRVDRAMKQYDAAAPGIDFATQYWWLLVIAGFGLGVAAGYTANVVYARTHRTKFQ